MKKKPNSTNYVVGKTHDFEINRGDLNLFNNSNVFLSCVFKAGVQLMALQGVRVMLFFTTHLKV